MWPSGTACLSADCWFQWASTIKIQHRVLVLYKADLIIIALKINLFSPWYSWKITELALNSNHSLDFHVDGASSTFLSYILSLRQFHSRHRKFIVHLTIAGCENCRVGCNFIIFLMLEKADKLWKDFCIPKVVGILISKNIRFA